MSETQLPKHHSLEYLKKAAKDRLRELRQKHPKTKLAEAQLAVAREYGFASWRAMKAEVERRLSGDVGRFFEACANADIVKAHASAPAAAAPCRNIRPRCIVSATVIPLGNQRYTRSCRAECLAGNSSLRSSGACCGGLQ